MYSHAIHNRPIKSDIVVAGIDVAKRRHVAAIRYPDGRIKKLFSFANNRQGFERLVSRVEIAGIVSGVSEILFALEATGHYAGTTLRN